MFSVPYSLLSVKYAFVRRENYGDTITGLIDCLRRLQDEGYVFRGQSDALWPIVSSAQRAYVKHLKANLSRPQKQELCYQQFLQCLLDFAKNERLLMPKLGRKCFGRKCLYDHEIWGWLQHYSYPTPFIDFTKDPMVALFMATRRMLYGEAHCPKMFSVYAMNANDEVGNETLRLEKWISEEKIRLGEINEPEEKWFSFAEWSNVPCILVHKDGTLRPWDQNLSKQRIASQSGLFVYLKCPNISLEHYLCKQNDMNKGEDGVGCQLRPIRCFDVPTTLAPYVSEFCLKEGYDEERLGLLDQSIDVCLKSLYARHSEVYG